MKYLDIPVPETLTASYIVPLPMPMSDKGVRKLLLKAARAQLSAPLATLTVNRLKDGSTQVRVLNPSLGEPRAAHPEPDDPAAKALMDAVAYVVLSFTDRPSLGAMQELIARATAASLAAHLSVPMLNVEAKEIVDPHVALAALPSAAYAPDSNIQVGVELKHWVTFDAIEHEGEYWAGSDGMRRFGLPELMMPGGEDANLRPQMKDFLRITAQRIWSHLDGQTTATLHDLPACVTIPAVMTIDGNLIGLSIHEGIWSWLRVWPLFDMDTLADADLPEPVRAGAPT